MTKGFTTARSAHVDSATRTVDVTLDNGDVYRCSLPAVSERLGLVEPSLLDEWEWIGPRAGLHWPSVDEDLLVEYLIARGIHITSEAGQSPVEHMTGP